MITKHTLGVFAAVLMLTSPALPADDDLGARLGAAIEKLEKAAGLVESYQSKITFLEERIAALEALPKPASKENLDEAIAAISKSVGGNLQLIRDLERDFTAIPDGTVIAVDHADGCPAGWEQFKDASGRFIIGVGGKYELPYVAGKPKYMIGGAETHTLTEEELPKLSSAANVRSALPLLSSLETAHVNRANSGGSEADVTSQPQGMRFATGAVVPRDDTKVRAIIFRFSDAASYLTIDVPNPGRNVPHNNMPPYIALYFCKKEAN